MSVRGFKVFEGVRVHLLGRVKTYGALFESGTIEGSASSREGTVAAGVGVESAVTEAGWKYPCPVILVFASSTGIPHVRTWTVGVCKDLERSSRAREGDACPNGNGTRTQTVFLASARRSCSCPATATATGGTDAGSGWCGESAVGGATPFPLVAMSTGTLAVTSMNFVRWRLRIRYGGGQRGAGVGA